MKKLVLSLVLAASLLVGGGYYFTSGPGGGCDCGDACACSHCDCDHCPHLLREKLLGENVTVVTDYGSGSGTVVIREGRVYVLTAHHVIDSLRNPAPPRSPFYEILAGVSGVPEPEVTYRDCYVSQYLSIDGESVGEGPRYFASVLTTSEKEDLALLLVKADPADFPYSADFHHSEVAPPVGLELYHVGSLLGVMGGNSLTDGIISQVGRVLPGLGYFDQTTATAYPGSSGGGVYVKATGRYVGMLVRGAGESFNLIVPVRRMNEWAERAGVAWALNPTLEVTKPHFLEE